MKRITLLLADDHALVRGGLRTLLESEKDFEVIGEAATGSEAAEMAARLKPAVVVMDIQMPQANGVEAARKILLAVPAAKVLMLSAHSDDALIEEAVEVGAQGYLLKQSAVGALAEAIRRIHKGEIYFGAGIAERLQARRARFARRRGALGKECRRLSAREGEVLGQIAEGCSNKEMAANLGISVKTVEKHRGSLMEKLGIHHTAGLTRYAMNAGLIEWGIEQETGA